MGDQQRVDVEGRFEDPLELVERILEVLRTEVDDRDAAIERLIEDLEDERAALVAQRLNRR